MKVLYIASNPASESNLNLLREVTDLQRKVLEDSAEPAVFNFLPQLSFEELPSILHKEKPDIVHFSAHADGEHIVFSTYSGKRVNLTGDQLRSFFNNQLPPKIVYLNCCDSHFIAEKIKLKIPIVIASTAAISNGSARMAAASFYSRILSGDSVHSAFEVCKSITESSMDNNASMEIFLNNSLDISSLILHQSPQIIAELDGYEPKKNGEYLIKLGLLGCPRATTQVIFFTDDESYLTDDKTTSDEDDLCHVVRKIPVRGVVWTEDFLWKADGDFSIFAIGVSPDGSRVSAHSNLCDALEYFYTRIAKTSVRGQLIDFDRISLIIKKLRQNDGSNLS